MASLKDKITDIINQEFDSKLRPLDNLNSLRVKQNTKSPNGIVTKVITTAGESNTINKTKLIVKMEDGSTITAVSTGRPLKNGDPVTVYGGRAL